MTKTQRALPASFALAALLLTACGASTGAGASDGVSLPYWNGHTSTDGEVLRDMAERFNEQHTGEIEVLPDIMPWDTFYQKLPPAIASNSAPPLTDFNNTRLPEYVATGTLQPLDDFWSESGLNPEDYNETVLDMGKIDGTTYMLPMNYFGIYLFWNKTLFEEAGLDPEKPPTTWEELADYAVQLTDPTKDQYGFGMPVPNEVNSWYMPLIWGNGGEVADLETKTSLLDSPQNIQSMEFLSELVSAGVSPEAPDDTQLAAGRIAMYINGPWVAKLLNESGLDYGITGPPAGTETQATTVEGTFFAIPVTASEEEKFAAYEFIEYWLSPDLIKEWSMKNNTPTYHNGLADDPELVENHVLSSIAETQGIERELLPGYIGASNIKHDALIPMVESILHGADPESAVRDASSTVDDILQTIE